MPDEAIAAQRSADTPKQDTRSKARKYDSDTGDASRIRVDELSRMSGPVSRPGVGSTRSTFAISFSATSRRTTATKRSCRHPASGRRLSGRSSSPTSTRRSARASSTSMPRRRPR